MAAPQQQQLVLDNSSHARLGLVRSRHDLNDGDGPANKKQKQVARSFAHTARTEVSDKKFKCNHCSEPMSENITRAKAHLLKCKAFLGSSEAAAAAEIDKQLKEAVDEYRATQPQKKQLVARQGMLTAASSKSSSTSSCFVKQWPKMGDADYKEARKAMALAVYSCNLPHSLIDQPDFRKMLLKLAPYLDGQLPSRKQLATTLLDDVYSEVKAEVQAWLDKQEYVATSTDAWSSRHNAGAHVLNVNAIANGTSVFLDFVWTGSDSCTHEYISEAVEKVVNDWAISDKVVAFVTDWGSNMLKAGQTLQQKLTNCIANVGCVQHLLNNALKDFAKEPSLSTCVEQVKKVVKYITSHTAPRAIYDSKKKELKGSALIKAGGTRFGTNISSMESVIRNEKVLRATVNSSEYEDYIQRQSKAADKQAALDIKGSIANTNSTLFEDTKWAVDTLAPFVSAIKEVEGDTAKLSDGYYAVSSLTKHVQQVSSVQGSFLNMLLDDDTSSSTLSLSHTFSQSFSNTWKPRAQQACSDLAVATAIIDPRYKNRISSMPPADLLRGERLLEALALRKLGAGADVKLKAQLMKYKNEPELIGATPAAVESTRTAGVKAEAFWLDLQPHAHELAKIAQMLLTIPPASATSERVYSAVGRVWDTKRSKLTNPRVRKLLFIYFNRKALMRDGVARDADDFAAFEEWLDSIPDEEPLVLS